MRKYATYGWIRPDDFVQIYSLDFGWKVERWLQSTEEVFGFCRNCHVVSGQLCIERW